MSDSGKKGHRSKVPANPARSRQQNAWVALSVASIISIPCSTLMTTDMAAAAIKNRPAAWTPRRSEIENLENVLIGRIRSAPALRHRIRFYSGTIEQGRRYIIGLLIINKSGSVANRDLYSSHRSPYDWPVGAHIVPISKFPSETSFVIREGCDWIQLHFDTTSNEVLPNACIAP